MMTNLGWRVVDDIDGVGRPDKISMALLWRISVMGWSRNGLDRCWLGGGIETRLSQVVRR